MVCLSLVAFLGLLVVVAVAVGVGGCNSRGREMGEKRWNLGYIILLCKAVL